jgi:hypothetical protein
MKIVDQDTIVSERVEELLEEISYKVGVPAGKLKEGDLVLKNKDHRTLLLSVFKEVLKRGLK